MQRPPEDWITKYQQEGALWFHDGNPRRPHALLTSGKHSSGFFNSEIVMEDPVLLEHASSDLVELLGRLLKDQIPDMCSITRVVGPAVGAITLAHEMARQISITRGFKCRRAFTEKETGDNGKLMVFKRTVIGQGELILGVEDVLSTGGSVDLMIDAIKNAGGEVMPYVCVLVNRSGLTEVSGMKIVSLIEHPMPMWTAEECPLCKEGSEAIRPKGIENWARLNGSC